MSNFFARRTWKRLALTGWLIPCVGLAFPQIAAWQFGNPASAGNEATYAATSLDPDLDYGTLSRGTGVAAAAWARGFSANGWDQGATQGDAIANDEYFQVIVEASAGHSVSLSTLDATLRKSNTGPDSYIWRYSVDGSTFHDIGTAATGTTNNNGLAQAQIDLSGIGDLQSVPSGTAIILRLYAWDATGAGGGGVFAIGRYAANNTTNSLAIDGTVDVIQTGPVVIAAWQFGDPQSAGSEVTYDATTLDANLETSTLGRGAGIAPAGLARGFSSNNWDAQNQADAITLNEYYEFIIQAQNGWEVSLSTLDVRLRRTGTGPNAYIWRYSTDGTNFSDIGSPASFTSTADGVDQAQIDLTSIGALQNAAHNTSLTLRLYAWGASGTGGTLAIGRYGNQVTTNSLTIGGNVQVSTAPPITIVEFAGSSAIVSEGAGTEDLTLTIANPSATAATSVDVVLVGGDAARIGNYTTQTVTWNAGDGSSKTVTITLTDNNDCDGNEQLTFELQQATGGESAEVGAADTYVLTVEDDDLAAVDAPVATAAANVDETSFTANWNAVTGATGYYLDVYTDGASGLLAEWTFENDGDVNPSSGTAANLAQEITTTAIGDITFPVGVGGTGDFSISSTGWDNGDGAKYWQVDLNTIGFSGLTVSSVQRSSNTGPRDFKVQYRLGPSGTWTDVPGATVATANNYTTGVLSNVSLPAECGNQAELSLRWIMTSNISVNGGTVPAAGTSRIDDINISATGGTMYVLNNEDVGSVTQYNVTGLTGGTEYHYVVRAYNSCDTSSDSNVMDVTTTPGTAPVLSAGTLNDFGSLCVNTASAPQSFHVDGENLTGDDVTVAALAGFTFSTTQAGTYTSSLSIPQAGGTFSQDIWVIFTPTAEQSYDGNITVGGGGAAAIQVQATGSGANTLPTVEAGTAYAITQNSTTMTSSAVDYPCATNLLEIGIEYSTTMGFTPGTGTQVQGNTEDHSTVVLNGLDACTVYYFRAYGVFDLGTAYSDEDQFETQSIDAPVATAATGILTEEFTANWNAVAGATGYFLDVSTSPTFGSSGPATLYYGDGRDDLPAGWSQTGLGTDYTTNTNYGLSSPSLKFDNSGDQLTTEVISGPANSLSFWYKGQGTAASASTLTIEAFDGNAWITIGTLTGLANNYTDTWSATLDESDNYIQFRFTYTKVTGNLAFDDLTVGYTGFEGSFVTGYENLAVGGTSHQVSGLAMSTTYYYRVRAVAGDCTSNNSNTEEVTTLACSGNAFVVAIQTDDNGGEITWEVYAGNDMVANGGPYTGQDNVLVTESFCLGNAPVDECYTFYLYDSNGDGLNGNGFWQIRTLDGAILLGDDFGNGYATPGFPTASPSYPGHMFCLPLGPANIAPSECGIFNNQLGNKVYSNKVTGASNYQFEFSDPDAGFIRRIARPHNYVLFSDMVTNPLVPGVKYFARVRTDRDGPMAQAHWGTGCEMGIGTAVLGCSELINCPAYGHSCNEERPFNTNNSFIYAKPVTGATEYQFRIYNLGELYDETFTRATYILQLKWSSNVAGPLKNGYTYKVEVNAKVNGVWTGFCPSTCTITINNALTSMPGCENAEHVAQVGGQATLWPNPVQDGQVNLSIDGMKAHEQDITVEVRNLYGTLVHAQQFANAGERFNTVLNLPGEVASGIYMVNITINGELTTKRLSIIR